MDRPDGQDRLIELVRLIEAQRAAGSELAERLLHEADLAAAFWLVEPIGQPATLEAADSQPDRNQAAALSTTTADVGVPTLDR